MDFEDISRLIRSNDASFEKLNKHFVVKSLKTVQGATPDSFRVLIGGELIKKQTKSHVFFDYTNAKRPLTFNHHLF